MAGALEVANMTEQEQAPMSSPDAATADHESSAASKPGSETQPTHSFARQLCDNLVPEVWAEIQALAAPQLAAERDQAREERHRADVMVERHRQLLHAAKRVADTMPEGKHVAVDLAAYNDLRDVLRGIGVLA